MAEFKASHLQLGWIGLGNMGLAMATNLQKHLVKLDAPALRYNNRTMSRGQPLRDLGAVPSDTTTNLVQHCDLIFICLADDTAVESITAQILSSGDLTSKIIVDTSTISPSTTDSISTQLTSAGASFLACPAFGATPVAINGQLLMAIAGPAPAVNIVKPYLESCLARSVIVVGQDPIQATLLKTTGNFITAAFAETISEAHVFAEKSNLSPTVLDDLIKQNYGEYAHSISQKLITGVYLPPRGERPRSDLTLAVKDVSHGIEYAKEVEMTLDVAEVTMGHLFQAKRWAEQEGRALDSSAVYGVVRMESGLDFETEEVRRRDGRAGG